jgi:hypothetical protein
MKKNVLIATVFLLTSAASAGSGEYLVQVYAGSSDQVQSLAASGVSVISELNDGCLALLKDWEFARLGDVPYRVLDSDPREHLYLFVMPRPEVTEVTLGQLGTILLAADNPEQPRFNRVYLLRTTEERVLDLNRLPVELCRLSMEPKVFDRAEDGGSLPEPRALSDSLVAAIAGSVSQDSVLSQIRRMQKFYTRYSTTDSCRASVNWMQNLMRSYNCDTVYGHVWRSSYAPNAVGVKWGRSNPRRIYIVDGHIDNTSDQSPSRCPGSDDNASGTAAAIEACRVFADYDFDYTVYFIGFTGEEQGLWGSDSFSARALRRHDTILGVFNFDMISYGRTGYDGIIVNGRSRNPNCSALVKTYCANADTYTTLSYSTHYFQGSGSGYGSDHYYFWERNYKGVYGEENDFTPMYHTIGDTIATANYRNCGTNNIPQCTEAIRAAVATLAKLAGVHRMTGVEESAARERIWRIEANVPNPFADRTAIRYSAPADPGARVRIYDASGTLVRELVGAVSGQDRTAVWDGRDAGQTRVAPGVYFYRLEGIRSSPLARAVLVGR